MAFHFFFHLFFFPTSNRVFTIKVSNIIFVPFQGYRRIIHIHRGSRRRLHRGPVSERRVQRPLNKKIKINSLWKKNVFQRSLYLLHMGPVHGGKAVWRWWRWRRPIFIGFTYASFIRIWFFPRSIPFSHVVISFVSTSVHFPSGARVCMHGPRDLKIPRHKKKYLKYIIYDTK